MENYERGFNAGVAQVAKAFKLTIEACEESEVFADNQYSMAVLNVMKNTLSWYERYIDKDTHGCVGCVFNKEKCVAEYCIRKGEADGKLC